MDDANARSTLIDRINLYNGPGGNCVLCLARVRGAPLCGDCAADLPRNDPIVQTHPVPWIVRLVAPFAYRFPLDRLLQSIKFERDLVALDALLPVFCDEVSLHIPRPSVIVPVPLGRLRHARRGFNQSTEIALGLASALNVPVLTGALSRVRETAPQTLLDATGRRQNVVDAFAVRRTIDRRHIVLVDDVATTGATLSAAARVLVAAGADGVTAVTLARARGAR